MHLARHAASQLAKDMPRCPVAQLLSEAQPRRRPDPYASTHREAPCLRLSFYSNPLATSLIFLNSLTWKVFAPLLSHPMATLASIPEASSSRPNSQAHRLWHEQATSYERHRPRPRSRIIIHPRRQVRTRHPVGTISAIDALPSKHALAAQSIPQSNNVGAAYRTKFSPATSNKALKSCTAERGRISPLDRAPFGEQAFDPSESSVDLDSFPLPPSGDIPLQQRRYPTQALPLTQDNTTRSKFKTSGPSHSRREVACESSSSAKHTSIDSALVEAITRNITQQLRLFSATRRSERPHHISQRSRKSHLAVGENQSRSSSQRVALDRFTKELQQYAEHTGAKGKAPYCTPTPPKSVATLQTVSALMPFRPEFRAAGLAVTSKEQARRIPTYITKAVQSQAARKRPEISLKKNMQTSQFDGNVESGSSSLPNTEMSFAGSRDVDEWRYALIDEAPNRKQKPKPDYKQTKSRCLPCFPGDDGTTTDADWAHFRRSPAQVNRAAAPVAANSSRVSPPVVVPPSLPPPSKPPPPRPPRSPLPALDSTPPSPRHRSKAPDTAVRRKATLMKLESPSKSTSQPKAVGIRRPSQTLPQENVPLEACSGTHRLAKGHTPYHKVNRRPASRPEPLQTQPVRSQCAKPPDLPPLSNQKVQQPLQRPYQSLPKNELPLFLPKPRKSSVQRQDRYDLLTDSPSEDEVEKMAKSTTKAGSLVASKGNVKTTGMAKRRTPCFDSHHVRICCRSRRGIPARARARPNIPRRTSSIRGSPQSTDMDYDDRNITDRDVLRGLHVAASAACNEEVDAFVRTRTGMRIRRFLADLMAIETLGNRNPDNDTEHQARRRRGDMRKLKQQVRRSREIRKAGLI